MPNQVTLKLSQVLSIAVAALALGFSGALSTPAVAQGRNTAQAAEAEYQAIALHASAVRQSLIAPKRQAALADWAGIIADLKSWGVRHAIPLGSDTASVRSSPEAAGAATRGAQALWDQQCVVQYPTPRTKVPATIQYWVSSGVVTEVGPTRGTLSCVYLVTPIPASGGDAWQGGVEKAPTGNWDLKANKAL